MQLNAFLKTLGKRISEARKRRSLTQLEASRLAQISYRYLQRIESGKVNLTMSTLLRILIPFNLHPAEILPSTQEWKQGRQ